MLIYQTNINISTKYLHIETYKVGTCFYYI